MPKKNPPPPKRRKYCLGVQKDLDGIYEQLRNMMSSEEEDEDDDDEESLMNRRLDDIQNNDVDYDLLEMLSDTNDPCVSGLPKRLPPPTDLPKSPPPPIDDQIPTSSHEGPDINLPESPSVLQTDTNDPCVSGLPKRLPPPTDLPKSPPPPIDDQIPTSAHEDSDINLPESPSVLQTGALDIHLPTSSDNHQNINLESNDDTSASALDNHLPASPLVSGPDIIIPASPSVDDQLSALDIHLHMSSDNHQNINLESNDDTSASALDNRLPANPPVSGLDIDIPASPSVDDQLAAAEIHSPASRPGTISQVTSSRSRPSYSQVQNRRWVWETDIEDYDSLTFERPMKVIKAYNNRSQPKDYFMDFCPDEATDLIVKNTNIYAQAKNSKNWVAVTKDEINAFLGMVILMSINPLSDYQLYWSSDPFYNNPVISEVMTLKRFKKICENFHISNILEELPRTSPNYNKLCKVQPLIDILNVTFGEACEQSATQSIDESMIRFKGRSSMKQYMPKKPIKRGYKCWARCDSKTGYLYQFQFYTGKIGNSTEENLGYRVVMDLSEVVPRNTLLAFDNFFTSLGLLTALHQRMVYAVGTVRMNRKGLPENLSSRNRETRLNPGEFMYWYSRPISVVKWKDSKDVFVASTAHSPREVLEITRKQKDGSKKKICCPIAIKEYTDYMGGVDLFDHYRSSYPIGRKSRKNWHRLFWFLYEAAIINAYIAYMKGHSDRRNTHRDFRLCLGRSLINNYSSRIKTAPVFKMKKGGLGVPDEVRLVNVGSHMPKLGKFRRCRHCSTKQKEQRSKYVCSTYNVPLCAAPCFEQYHLVHF